MSNCWCPVGTQDNKNSAHQTLCIHASAASGAATAAHVAAPAALPEAVPLAAPMALQIAAPMTSMTRLANAAVLPAASEPAAVPLAAPLPLQLAAPMALRAAGPAAEHCPELSGALDPRTLVLDLQARAPVKLCPVPCLRRVRPRHCLWRALRRRCRLPKPRTAPFAVRAGPG